MEVPNISLATKSRWRSATISWYTSSPSKDMLSCWSTAAPRTSVPLEWHRLGSSRSMSWALWMKMGGNKHTWNSQKMVKIGVRAKTAQLRRKTAQWRVKTAHSENSKIRKTGKIWKGCAKPGDFGWGLLKSFHISSIQNLCCIAACIFKQPHPNLDFKLNLARPSAIVLEFPAIGSHACSKCSP